MAEWQLMCLAWSRPSVVNSSDAGASIPSNLVVVKDLLGDAVDSLLAIMPRPNGRTILVVGGDGSESGGAKGESAQTGDDLLENILTERLTGMGLSVRLAEDEASPDSLDEGSSVGQPVLDFLVV